jgi:hypothetical protein
MEPKTGVKIVLYIWEINILFSDENILISKTG